MIVQQRGRLPDRKLMVQDDSQDEWVPEGELDILDRAKLLGLRICTHRSISFARHADAVKAVKPTFDLLASVFANDGQINDKTGEGSVKHPNKECRTRSDLSAARPDIISSFEQLFVL